MLTGNKYECDMKITSPTGDSSILLDVTKTYQELDPDVLPLFNDALPPGGKRGIFIAHTELPGYKIEEEIKNTLKTSYDKLENIHVLSCSKTDGTLVKEALFFYREN